MKKIILMVVVAFMATTTYAQTSGFGVRAGVNLANAKLSIEDLSPSISIGTKTGFYVAGVYNLGISETFGIQAELGYALSGSRLSGGSKTIIGLLGQRYDDILSNAPDKKVAVGFTNHNITIPILARYTQGGLSVLAGPYFSYTVATKATFNSNVKSTIRGIGDAEGGTDEQFDALWEKLNGIAKEVDKTYDKAIKKFDLGFTLGAEYAFKNGLFVDVRYNQSLLNTFDKKVIPVGTEEDGNLFPIDRSKIKLNARSIQIGVGFRF